MHDLSWLNLGLFLCEGMALIKFLPIMIGRNCWKEILYFTMAKHRQMMGNKNNALVRIGKSLVESNIWRLWPAKMFQCIGKRLAVIGNQYFTNGYQYIITLVACVMIDWLCKWSVCNKSNSKREFFQVKSSRR